MRDSNSGAKHSLNKKGKTSVSPYLPRCKSDEIKDCLGRILAKRDMKKGASYGDKKVNSSHEDAHHDHLIGDAGNH